MGNQKLRCKNAITTQLSILTILSYLLSEASSPDMMLESYLVLELREDLYRKKNRKFSQRQYRVK